MASSRPPYLLLFCISAALLALAAFAFSPDAHEKVGAPNSGPASHIDPQPLRSAAAAHPGLRRLHGAARRFLTAFLRYEVGDLSRSVRRQLHRCADARFVAELLARPPRGISPAPSLARIVQLQIALLSRSPGRALVSGSALRAGRTEQFSFLFEANRGTWRAVGPGE